jgi:large subunit ribosomal protein L6
MSRIGRLPIPFESGVEVSVSTGVVRVTGPRGVLEQFVVPRTQVEVEDRRVVVRRADDSKRARAAHGLMRSLVANMVEGVTQGYAKTLEIVGVGYRAEVSGSEVRLNVGFSHPVVLQVPKEVKVAAESPTRLVVQGADKQKVGQFAADIRKIRPPEPYKGKGIRYANERVRRKVGKAGVGA